jgi:hypothetical protein
MHTDSHRFADTARLVPGGRSTGRASRTDLIVERRSMKPSSPRHPEWMIVRRLRVNALLTGADHLTGAAVARLETSVRQPLVWWAPAVTADLPQVTAGTLVIRDVDRLEVRQQESLATWLGAHTNGLQVLSLAREPMYERVAEDQFSAALYSCINTVMLELQAPADLP